MPSNHATLAAQGVAAYGLPGGAALPDVPLTPSDWEAMIKKVHAHRIAGFLMQAVQEGNFAVDEQQRRHAGTLFKQARVYTVALQSHLLHVAGLLEQADVDYRVLKGAALAALAYPDQSLRPYGDIDILVQPTEFEYTVELLERAGYSRALGWHRVGHAHDKGTTLIANDDCAVDLHYALTRGPYRWLIASADLFAEPQTFPLGTRRLPTLSSPVQFLHVCLHARIGDIRPRLLSIRDVAQCALHTDLNWTIVQQLCEKWQTAGVASEALRLTQDVLRIPTGDSARSLTSHRRSKREQRLMRPYESQKMNYNAFLIGTLAAIPGVVRKVDYAYNLILPGKQYMRGNMYESHRQRWRHVIHAVAALLVRRLRRSFPKARVFARHLTAGPLSKRPTEGTSPRTQGTGNGTS
jgi:hypothetical protein